MPFNKKKEAILSKPTKPTGLEKVVFCNVAGVTFENRQENISRININTPIKLVRDPENTHDSNAVKVMTIDKKMLGWIPRRKAFSIAKVIDQDNSVKAEIVDIVGDRFFSNLGLRIRLVYEKKKYKYQGDCYYVDGIHYDKNGYDREGYDMEGYNIEGLNRQGLIRGENGKPKKPFLYEQD